MCPKCPVEIGSKCAKDQLSKITQNVCGAKPLDREEVPAVYCATGMAACTDLEAAKDCVCVSCEIYATYKLSGRSPSSHYCKDGMAR